MLTIKRLVSSNEAAAWYDSTYTIIVTVINDKYY